ncbi:helix-turn-helix domain protein [Stanieria cyanosphaera PCC 7437]|uniref:Helix-turn-helix domain protein n=1 Tax=Stanieria cyanosphaera (strain ATCC 29371 / PCC 7437) TaxID=111780 RepID=K9XQF9_STAC7|nr:helix-turn-helix domain protein [Stanieria cyanosphaera PCC 7437]
MKKNINAYRLAQQTGIDKTYLSKLISGVIKKPGHDKLAKIAQVLELKPSQLLAIFTKPQTAVAELNVGEIKLSQQQTVQYSGQDWGEAPDGMVCYGRLAEIETSRQWLIQERCRVIILYGLGGIGKTTLAVHLAKQFQKEFDYIFWRSLAHAPSIETVLSEAIVLTAHRQTFEATVAQKISQLLFQLRQSRCLLIFDQIESILATGNATQPYQDEHQMYGELFRQIAQLEHQSCLLLIGNEKPKDLAILESASASIRSLQLQGLTTAARQLLEDKQLSEIERWDELIEIYRGHPLALKIVATTIKEVFNGSISEFLRQNTLFLGDLEFVIDQQYHRLSDAEKTLICAIAKENQLVSIPQLMAKPTLSMRCSEMIGLLDCLRRRSLLETVQEHNQTFYTLQPVIRKYLNSYY